MPFTPQKGVLVKKPLTVWFFFERKCPICEFVKRYVLRPMASRGIIKLERYEINSNIKSPAVKWFYDYSHYEMGEVLTPTIRLVDIYCRGEQLRIDSVKICHLWQTKPKRVGHEDEEKAKELRNQLLEAINLYRRKPVRGTHDIMRLRRLPALGRLT